MKLYHLLFMLSIHALTQSSPQCMDYQGRLLRQGPFTHVECLCNCNQQYHTDIVDKKGRRCLQCGHKLIQTDPIIHEKISKKLLLHKKAVTPRS